MKNYHADIINLPTVTQEIVYTKSNVGDTYFIVPTEMIISRSADHDLWKGCPELVNYDIVDCIIELENKNEYPYNRAVGELFCLKNGLKGYEDHSFLSAVVYCSQHYHSRLRDEKNALSLHIKLLSEGFVITNDEVFSTIGNKKCIVVINGQTLLGDNTTRKSDTPLKFKEFGEGKRYWMKPRATRTGYPAYNGQYIKIIN